MRRLLLYLVATVGLCFSISAQDIIVTTDAQRLDVKIIDISSTEVLYHSFSPKDTAVNSIPLSEVVSILYENGKVAIYNNSLSDASLYSSVYRQPILPGVIAHRDGAYFLSTGDEKLTKMSEEAYLKFIESNCPEAWQSYQKANRMWNIGWRFFGTGIGLEVVGLPVYLVGLRLQRKSEKESSTYGYGMSMAGIIMMAGGGVSTIVSIPLLAVSDHRRKNTQNIYNECYFEQHVPLSSSGIATEGNSVSLHLQATANGLGLAVCF